MEESVWWYGGYCKEKTPYIDVYGRLHGEGIHDRACMSHRSKYI